MTDRDDFQSILSGADFVIGQATISRATGDRVIPIAVPVRPDGSTLQSVLIAALDIDQVLLYARRMDLPPQSAALIVDEQGTVITRYPDTETWSGRSLPQVPMIQESLQGAGEGSGEAVGIDGITRLFAFSPLMAGSGLSVSVGIPSAVAYADADRLLRTNLIWIGIAALLALSAAWYAGDALILRIVSLTAERDRAESDLRLANTRLEERVAQRTEELAQANQQLESELAERQKMLASLRERKAELSLTGTRRFNSGAVLLTYKPQER